MPRRWSLKSSSRKKKTCHPLTSASEGGPAHIRSGARSRSPSPGSRGRTSFDGTCIGSSTVRKDDSASESYTLPLPSGSPVSPSSIASARFPITGSPIHSVSTWYIGSSTVSQDDSASESYPLLPLPCFPLSPSSSASNRFPISKSPTHLVSKWKRGKLLGSGTFGHVYLGFNSETGKFCAIKQVHILSCDRSMKESLKQLNQEVNLLSQLSHPNIVKYYGSELDDETLSVYLEYVPGGSIHELVQEFGPFNETVIRSYTRQILSGLAYLHARNVVHRDIKPANILLGPRGEVKLADFGMAKHMTSCASVLSFKDSPYWMAPEEYSLLVDIWSLGCTVLEMATSKPPWSQYEGVAGISETGNNRDVLEIPTHLSEEAKNFINLCLQTDPACCPTAFQLLEHPFVRQQTTQSSSYEMIRDGFF